MPAGGIGRNEAGKPQRESGREAERALATVVQSHAHQLIALARLCCESR